jgi:hypothetical protein
MGGIPFGVLLEEIVLDQQGGWQPFLIKLNQPTLYASSGFLFLDLLCKVPVSDRNNWNIYLELGYH